MPNLDQRAEQALADYAAAVQRTLGDQCVGVVLYGSAAGVDWHESQSDLNTVVVVRRAGVAALAALAPVIAQWRRCGLALPLVLDAAQVEQAHHLFPMELDDIRRQHRVLAGVDPFAGLATDEAALRRECAQEAFGKLLRLRASYLEHAAQPAALERMMVDSVKSFLIVLRHALRSRGSEVPNSYQGALLAGEAAFGALPAMRRALARRQGEPSADLAGLASAYVEEAERLVAAVTVDGG
jgi:hypothetical protein